MSKRRVDRLEDHVGRPGAPQEKPAGVLLYDRATVRVSDEGKPLGPFTLASTGETIDSIEEANRRFGVLVVMPRNGREAPPEAYQ